MCCLRCGKFVNISVGDSAHLLRRPLAICEYDEKSVTVCYQLKGSGTKSLSKVRAANRFRAFCPSATGSRSKKTKSASLSSAAAWAYSP